MATVCAEIAVRDDRRLLDALASLDRQLRRPDRVLVAASIDTPESLLSEVRQRFPNLTITIGRFPGGVVDARAAAIPLVSEEITAFLDSDEVAPPEWLGRLVAPLEAGAAVFSGGPTRPLRAPATAIERYSVLLEESIYEGLVPTRVTYLPLQNTAWRTETIRRLGFDPRIPFAEDHDLETRAARAGATGVFVADAWVFHDPRVSPGFGRWARKRYRYLVAMAMSLIKNRELGTRLDERRRAVRHPLRFVEALMKPIALVDGTLRWKWVSGRRIPEMPGPARVEPP